MIFKKILNLFVLLNVIKTSFCMIQTIDVFGVHILWENQGSQTFFNVTSSLGTLTSTTEAWLAIGINNQPSMVSLIVYKIL